MDLVTLALAKKFTKDTADALGAVQGAPCTIKSIVHRDGVNIVTFRWTGTSGEERETVMMVNDGTPIYTWESGNHYQYGDLCIYASCFYRCISENSDIEFDDTKWNEIGSPDGNYDIVQSSDLLPARFTAADRELYYSIEDNAFWLWNGSAWQKTRTGVGLNTTGTQYTVDGQELTAGEGAEIFNDYSDNIAAGSYSHAEGDSTQALNSYAHAEGNRTVASGGCSHAEGNNTTASGYSSHAEGNHTVASGLNTHAEGSNTTASADQSHAEGAETTASGSRAHAEGYYTEASGRYSHAEGYGSIASEERAHAEGNGIASGYNSHAEGESTASGRYSHSECFSTTAEGQASHAEGSRTRASGQYSHAEGESTFATGQGSHSEGQYASASGNYSHAEGIGTDASSNCQHVQGKWNKEDASGKFAFIIGNGTSVNNRSNALAIDWNGLIYINNSETGASFTDFYTKLQTDTRITEKVVEIVADAPEDFDTLKEISDWISGHEDSAAAMNSAIQANTTAIAGKVDKVSGKDLSTNDYTTAEKTKLAALENYDDSQIVADISALQTSVSGKVDAISGMGLSQNSFTDAEKAKLAGIETGATSVTVDREITKNSVNPVSSFAVWDALEEKAGDIAIGDKAVFGSVYGLGTAITSGTDLNSLTTQGNYYSPSSSISVTLLNCPLPYNGFRLNVYLTSSSARIEQELIPNVVDVQCHEVYKRSIVSGTAGAWYKFVGEAVQASGTNAASAETNASETI